MNRMPNMKRTIDTRQTIKPMIPTILNDTPTPTMPKISKINPISFIKKTPFYVEDMLSIIQKNVRKIK